MTPEEKNLDGLAGLAAREAQAVDRIVDVVERYDGPSGEGARLLSQVLAARAYRLRRSGKECSRCRETKPISAFGPDTRRPDGLRYVCRSCEAADTRRRRNVV